MPLLGAGTVKIIQPDKDAVYCAYCLTRIGYDTISELEITVQRELSHMLLGDFSDQCENKR